MPPRVPPPPSHAAPCSRTQTTRILLDHRRAPPRHPRLPADEKKTREILLFLGVSSWAAPPVDEKELVWRADGSRCEEDAVHTLCCEQELVWRADTMLERSSLSVEECSCVRWKQARECDAGAAALRAKENRGRTPFLGARMRCWSCRIVAASRSKVRGSSETVPRPSETVPRQFRDASETIHETLHLSYF